MNNMDREIVPITINPANMLPAVTRIHTKVLAVFVAGSSGTYRIHAGYIALTILKTVNLKGIQLALVSTLELIRKVALN